MRRKSWLVLLLFLFVGLWWKAGRGANPSAPYAYGFLGGDFYPDEDTSFSTWNDIHFACHFSEAGELQGAIAEVHGSNQVLIDLGRAWQSRTPSCDLDGPWGDVGLFVSRVQPLLPVLNRYRARLLALWIFDEPDTSHGGPKIDDLRLAIDYLHQNVPGVPVFVNWFTPDKNMRLANADWYSTTQGGDPSVLSGLGKPMFLWEINPDSLEVLSDCKVEPSVRDAAVGTRYQFERLGYFCVDRDSTPANPVFNRTIGLRDTWAKIEQRGQR